MSRVEEEGDGVALARESVLLPVLKSRHGDLGERRRRPRQGEFRLLGTTLHTLSASEAATWLVREAARRPLTPVIATHASVNDLRALRRAKVLAPLTAAGRILLEGGGMKAVALAAGLGWRRDCDRAEMAGLVFERCARFGITVYLLGEGPKLVKQVVQLLRERYPTLRIVGARQGSVGRGAEARIARRIRESGAAVLIQSRSSPLQEEFALRCSRELGVSVVWNAGGLFESLAGTRPQAPGWVRRARLEWVYRMSLALRLRSSRSSAA